ncbi:MAG: hypothetical protein AAGJ38_00975 [Planctomycetota bacterium]
MLVNQAHASPLVLDNGGVNDFPPITLVGTEQVDILDGPGGATTTMNLLDGGSANTVVLFENSVLNISGGTMQRVEAGDSAFVNMTGGFLGDNIILRDDAQAHVSGGSLFDFVPRGNSVATLSGDALVRRNFSAVEMSRGEISGGTIGGDVLSRDDAIVLMSGGRVDDRIAASLGGDMRVTGGTWGGVLRVFGGSNITLFGDFNFEHGIYTDDSLLDDALITGTLADGSLVSNIANISNTGTITLAAIPEPGCVALIGVGVLSLGMRPSKDDSLYSASMP